MTEEKLDNSALLAKDDSSKKKESLKNDSAKTQSKIKSKAKPAARKSASWLIVILLVISIAGLYAAWMFWTQINQQLDNLTNQQALMSEDFQVYQSKIISLENNNAALNQNWQQSFKQLENLVVNSAQKWNQQTNRSENRWPLEEALTLMRLAQQRLQLDSSQMVALGLLASADKILSGLDQAAVLPIRRQLAADMLALKSTSSADVNGLYFKLDAISSDLNALTWVPKPNINNPIEENDNPAEGFLASIKTVFVISRQDIPFKAPALQNDFERWRQHSLLLIEQTQLALLAHNQSLFEVARTQSSDYLQVMSSQFHTKTWATELSEMENSVLNPQWPDIQSSVDALELYLSEQPETIDESQVEVAQ